MKNLIRKTIIRGAIVALFFSAGALTTANATVTRLSGGDRYLTSDAIVSAGWEAGADTAILASGLDANKVEALTVAPLAKAKNAPVVLVNPKDSVATIVAKFTDLNTKTVYIASGVDVISTKVEEGLKLSGISTVKRLGGANRYITAINIAKALGASNSIVIASGDNAHLVDSLSIASIAAAKGMPIFLAGSSLDDDTATYINSLGAEKTYVLGGPTVVSDRAVSSLKGITRLFGDGRYETNAKVVDSFKTDAALDLNNVFIASGENSNLIDSLAGAPLASLTGAPIVFVHDTINPAVKTLLLSIVNSTTNITELGGINAVTTAAHRAINTIQTGIMFNHTSYNGGWVTENTLKYALKYAGTNLSIKVDIDGNVSGTAGNNTENLSHLCNVDFKGKIIDDKLICDFDEDNWGHNGTITLDFEENKIILTIKYDANSSKDSPWGIGEGTFTLINSLSKVNKTLDNLKTGGLQVIEDQCFTVNLENFGNVKFISGSKSEGTDIIGTFNLVDSKNNVLYKLPEFYGNNKGTFTGISAISFTDANNDGLLDIIIIANYKANEIPITICSIYFQKGEGFINNKEFDDKINSSSNNKDIATVLKYAKENIVK